MSTLGPGHVVNIDFFYVYIDNIKWYKYCKDIKLIIIKHFIKILNF